MPDLIVKGMTCQHCQRAVEDALASVPGSQHVRVDLEGGTASVGGSPDTAALIRAVEGEGYRASVAPAPGGGA